MKQAVRNLTKTGRKNELIWRYGFNLMPTLNYRFGAIDKLDDAGRRVLQSMNDDGIAITSVAELFGDCQVFEQLETAVGGLLSDCGERIQTERLKAGDADAVGSKTFNIELLGSEPEFDPDSPFARFALQDKLLNIVNGYFKMRAKLRYYNVWYTFATDTSARESQLWHFDREDNYILKIFVYLKDVDEGAGPFTYAPKTHRKGKLWARQPEFFLEGGVPRSTDEQMAEVVPREDWIKATGSKWTIVFADTRGYHKGGEAKTDDRLMYTCMFTSQASQSKKLLKFPGNGALTQLNKKQLSAVEPF